MLQRCSEPGDVWRVHDYLEVYEDFPQLGGDGPPIMVGFDRRDAPEAIPAIGVPIFAIKGTQFLVRDA